MRTPANIVAVPLCGLVLAGNLASLLATGWLFRSKVRSWAFAAFGTAAAVWCWQSWQTAGLTRLAVLPLSGGQAIYFDAPGSRNGNCSGVGQTSGLPVHGASGSVKLVRSERRARGPANRQTGGLPHPPT